MGKEYLQHSKYFTFQHYVHMTANIATNPEVFFSGLPEDIGWKQAASFLIVSSAFYTLLSMLYNPSAAFLLTGGIYFVNAAGMPLIACVVGYILIRLMKKQVVPFTPVLSVYFFSSGVTLLVSWMPTVIFFAEIWRWWLIGIGITRICGIVWWQTAVIIGLSIIIIVSSVLGFNFLMT